MNISNDEWSSLADKLETHHAIFYKLWSVGKPILVDHIPTAAVSFDKIGKCVNFYFNTKFWSSLETEAKLFVICHEMLHVILNHGHRSKNASRINQIPTNIALDVVVNQSLIQSFGFSRPTVTKQIVKAFKTMNINDSVDDPLCWIDTIFPDKQIKQDECFEYYYNQFKKEYKDGMPLIASISNKGTLDDHDMMNSHEWADIHKFLSEELLPEEIEAVKSFIGKNFESNKDMAGTHNSDNWVFWKTTKIQIKKPWETVIKKWENQILHEVYDSCEQWARVARRYSSLKNSFFIPSEVEIHHERLDDDCLDVFFFLDTSGSCWHLKDRFFAAANSLNKQKFRIRLFCFDTKVTETDLNYKKIYGGGGTSFSILEEFVQREIQRLKIKHPTIFVITDGYGDSIFTKNAKKWFWFITEYGTRHYIDKKCDKIYNLNDFV